MILKTEGGTKLTDSVTHDANADSSVRDRSPAFRSIGIVRHFLKALDRLLRRAHTVRQASRDGPGENSRPLQKITTRIKCGAENAGIVGLG